MLNFAVMRLLSMKLLAILLASTAPTPAQFVFEARRDIRLPYGAWDSLSIADWNNDGHLDFLAGLGFLGRGDGTFRAPIFMPTAYNSSFADVNGDGRVDIVSASSRTITVNVGNGDGTFGIAVESSIDREYSNPTFGDVNGDGALDLVLLRSLYDEAASEERFVEAAVAFGDGQGRFRVAFASVSGLAFAVGDFDGDGRSDILSVNEAGATEVHFGQVDSRLLTRAGPVISLRGLSHPLELAVGDFDSDGRHDIVIGATIFLSQGAGAFREMPSDPASNTNIRAVRATDWDGDGRLDLVTVTAEYLPARFDYAASVLRVFLGTGDGYYRPPIESVIGLQQVRGRRTFASGDFNEDGVQDLLITNQQSSSVSILLGKRDGSVETAPLLKVTGTDAVALADLNRDGAPDLIAVIGRRVVWLEGKRDGTLVLPPRTILTGPSYAGPLVAADFNGDGRIDLAVGGQTSNVRVALQTDAGGFQESSIPLPLLPFASLRAADLNGDGRLDLLSGGDEDLLVAMNMGGGMFSASRRLGVKAALFVVADWNRDGCADIVANAVARVDQNAPIVFLAGRGDGSFAAPVLVAEGAGVSFGDFDGDGNPDLAFTRISPGLIPEAAITVLRGNGDGTFGRSISYPLGYMYSGTTLLLQSRDFNGDGLVDLVWAAFNQVGLLAGDRENLVLSPQFFGASRSIAALVIGDLDNDGWADIITAGPFVGTPEEGEIAILRNRGGSVQP